MKPVDIFNKLIALSEVENYFGDIEPFDTKQEPHKRFGIGENSIVFRGIDNYITFKDCLNELYLFHSTISKTYSFEQFEKDFISHVRPYFINKKTIDQSEVDNFYKRILDIKLQKYTIIRGICVFRP